MWLAWVCTCSWPRICSMSSLLSSQSRLSCGLLIIWLICLVDICPHPENDEYHLSWCRPSHLANFLQCQRWDILSGWQSYLQIEPQLWGGWGESNEKVDSWKMLWGCMEIGENTKAGSTRIGCLLTLFWQQPPGDPLLCQKNLQLRGSLLPVWQSSITAIFIRASSFNTPFRDHLLCVHGMAVSFCFSCSFF